MSETIASPRTKVIVLSDEQAGNVAQLAADANDYHRRGRDADDARRKLLQELAGKDQDWELSGDGKFLLVRPFRRQRPVDEEV